MALALTASAGKETPTKSAPRMRIRFMLPDSVELGG